MYMNIETLRMMVDRRVNSKQHSFLLKQFCTCDRQQHMFKLVVAAVVLPESMTFTVENVT